MFNNWVYVVVVVAAVLGFGGGFHAKTANTADLERQLQLAYQEIEELKMKCERTALPRVEIKRPSAHKDF